MKFWVFAHAVLFVAATRQKPLQHAPLEAKAPLDENNHSVVDRGQGVDLDQAQETLSPSALLARDVLDLGGGRRRRTRRRRDRRRRRRSRRRRTRRRRDRRRRRRSRRRGKKSCRRRRHWFGCKGLGNSVQNGLDAVEDGVKEGVDIVDDGVTQALDGADEAMKVVSETAVSLGEQTLEGMHKLGKQTFKLGDELETRMKKAGKIKNLLNNAVDRMEKLGKSVGKKIGALAVGLADAAVDFVDSVFDCFGGSIDKIMCEVMLGKFCDCDNGSSASLEKMRFVCTASFGLENTYTFENDPGTSSVKSVNHTAATQKPAYTPQKITTLFNKAKTAVRASCDAGGMSFGVSGAVEFSPTIELQLLGDGLATLVLSGAASAVATASVIAEGAGCNFEGKTMLLNKPKMRTFCFPYMCILVAINAFIETVVTGDLDGSVKGIAEAGWGVSASVQVNNDGTVDTDITEDEIWFKKGVVADGSFNYNMQISMGPQILVFFMPGVPIDIVPKVTIEFLGEGSASASALLDQGDSEFASAQRQLTQTPAPSLLDLNASSVEEDACLSHALNIKAFIEIGGIGLPFGWTEVFDSTLVEDMICEAATSAATATARLVTESLKALGDCLPGNFVENLAANMSSVVDQAASLTCETMKAAIPDFTIDLSQIPYISFFDDPVFCKNLWSHSTCGRNIGC